MTTLSGSALIAPRRLADHIELLVLGEVVDHDLEHEAVELRFREGIGALELDRVLGREDVEGFLEGVGDPLDGHPVLLHRLEKRRLRLRGRAVDLVGEHDVGEDRPGPEGHPPPTGGRVLLEDLRPGDVRRHEVRRELDPREVEVEHLCHDVDDHRLGEPRHAEHEAVAADVEGEEHLLEDVPLAHDLLAHFPENRFPAPPHPVRQLDIVPVLRRGLGRPDRRRVLDCHTRLLNPSR